MIAAVARVADGFVGHPIASADYLRDVAMPTLANARLPNSPALVRTSQVIAAVDRDRSLARRWAAQQVAFYSTVKGYDALFSDGEFAEERAAIRIAFAKGDLSRMASIADALVETRAVFGTVEDVAAQLNRYVDVLDIALLYPPHFGVEVADVASIERALVEVAACKAC
jgi:alkanesulfonate monooxygenase SsuD/methylene tetrahydromethanopterin reductase-like flavin-dependent oxidoreductase (luciferase family)